MLMLGPLGLGRIIGDGGVERWSPSDEREIAELEERLKEEQIEVGGKSQSVTESHNHLKVFSRKVDIRQEPGQGR